LDKSSSDGRGLKKTLEHSRQRKYSNLFSLKEIAQGKDEREELDVQIGQFCFTKTQSLKFKKIEIFPRNFCYGEILSAFHQKITVVRTTESLPQRICHYFDISNWY